VRPQSDGTIKHYVDFINFKISGLVVFMLSAEIIKIGAINLCAL